jgi:His/Glu/Gln/Arg/opine family amino acid ABC transporter permease subunit
MQLCGRKRAAGVAALVVCALVLAGCARTDYSWGWYVFNPLLSKGQINLKFMLAGLGATLAISFAAIVLSVILGMLLAVAGLSKSNLLRWINRIYVEVFRAIPILVLLLWVYYGLPVMVGLQLDAFAAGVLTLALSDAAFEAEVLRAGIQSVPRGQLEAADTLGFTRGQRFRYIVLPQAIRAILPALGNQFIYVLKMSSLVSVIGLQELTRRANELNVTEYRPLEIYTFLVIEYLVLILIVSWLVRRLERRMTAAPR